ncbi:hypothetical protein M5K25_020236 [Dendrobium thyrsiflorum]|uniref:Uncharacterized protein n=1 Tax=Dendrobium thyrsiflorum TaxID=117978 RepID=A0ABD0U9B8_DENTH
MELDPASLRKLAVKVGEAIDVLLLLKRGEKGKVALASTELWSSFRGTIETSKVKRLQALATCVIDGHMVIYNLQVAL